MSTNPYQTPEGQLTSDDFSYGEIQFFSPSSRINRLRYWAHSALITYALFALLIVVGVLAAFVSTTLGMVLGGIIYISMLVFSVILIVQRLHDLNKSGWLWLLLLIPFANIYLFVILIFFKGTEGDNDYGLQTPPNKTWHWVLAFSLPALMFVLGILAAIALPAYQDYVKRAKGVDTQYQQQFDSSTDDSGYPIEDASVSDEQINEAVDEAATELSIDAADDLSAAEAVLEGNDSESTEEAETPQ